MSQDDDTFFMSEELEGRVDLEQQDAALREIQNNTAILVIQCSNAAIVGGLRYFRREGTATAIEVSCSLDSAIDVLTAIESGNSDIDVLELHRGDIPLMVEKMLKIDGYYISDVDPVKGEALFGLKLSKRETEVL